MEVTEIVINGIIITTIDKPIGLEVIKLSLDRDFQYSCVDTKIEAELKFYCASGKTELDAEYESKGVEGSGYIKITDSCGTNAETYQFDLDFKKYNNQGEFTTIGLIDVNSLWKKDLDKEFNLDTYANGTPTNFATDFYVRNLQIDYDYSSENVYALQDYDTTNTEHRFQGQWIMPKVNTIKNELEDSDGLNMNYFVVGQTALRNVYVNDLAGVTTFISGIGFSATEPQEVFHNKIDSGIFDITTVNTKATLDFIDISNIDTRIAFIKEYICVGKKYLEARYIVQNIVANPNISIVSTTPTTVVTTYNKTYTDSFFIDYDEKVWIFYSLDYRSITPSGPNEMDFKKIQYTLENTVTAKYTVTKDTISTITSSADVVPYHTLIKAYYGQTILSTIFNCAQSFAQFQCYNDLWFSRGDLVRNKKNRADTIVKASDFFRELEKVVCCGLGYFYDTPTPQKKLMTVYDFYSDTLVPSQYQFSDSDLIDGIIEIAPFLAPYYKEIQIGYSNSKDTPRDFCKQNSYSIDNDSDSNYSKVSEFIASQYIITKALRLGSQEETLEFDDNIFILSGGQLGTYNATLSQTSGVLADTVLATPINGQGINRRYATVFNLFRHLYKWGFSLFADKDTLNAKKYEGNSIYDYAIQYLLGSPTPPYTALNVCKLPVSELVKVDRTIDNINDLIEKNIYVPSQITFKTAKLSSLDLIAMRAHQYDLFSVSDGVNTYYGNLISANLEDDVTEIKLLRRFKDGII
jgi:hypothetical protein